MSQRASLCSIAVGLMMAFPAAAQEDADKKTPPTEEDARFNLEVLPTHLARRLADKRKMLAQAGIGQTEGAMKGVIYQYVVWTEDFPQVKICFFGGSRKTRARIANIALEWKKAAPGVPLDFGDVSNPRLCKPNEINHIRVSVSGSSGYWSLPGSASYFEEDQEQPSMNLEGFDTDPPRPEEFRKTVLHEFGHALGLMHEHQSPWGQCNNEYNWTYIYDKLTRPPNNWSKEIIDHNMRELHNDGLVGTNYDPKSIMRYAFPPVYYTSGKASSCYSASSYKLSASDRDIIRHFYPPELAQRRAVTNEIRSAMKAEMEKSGAVEGSKSAVLQIIDEYLPDSASEDVAAEE